MTRDAPVARFLTGEDFRYTHHRPTSFLTCFLSRAGLLPSSGFFVCAVRNVDTEFRSERMAGKRQRTTFAKNQREKARMDKAAAKRARRLARKHESDTVEDPAGDGYEPTTRPEDRDESRSA